MHCRFSERSKIKCVGITIETRPDYCLKKHLRFVRITSTNVQKLYIVVFGELTVIVCLVILTTAKCLIVNEPCILLQYSLMLEVNSM